MALLILQQYSVGGHMPPQHSQHYPIQPQYPPGSRVMPGMVVPKGQNGVRAPPPYGSGPQYMGPTASAMGRLVPSQGTPYQVLSL